MKNIILFKPKLKTLRSLAISIAKLADERDCLPEQSPQWLRLEELITRRRNELWKHIK